MGDRSSQPSRFGLGLSVVAFVAGCPEGGFDPRGTEAAVTFAWTVRGEAPSSPVCAAIGARSVRLLLRAGAGRRIDRDLVWACDDSPVTTEAIFDAATVDLALEMLDGQGSVVAYADWLRRTLVPGDNVIGTFDLAVSAPPPDASLAVAWTVAGGPADAASCAAIGPGAATVRLVWRIGGFEGAPFDYPCEAGAAVAPLAFRSGVPTDFRLLLSDADGFAVAQSAWFPERSLEPGDNALPTVDFAVAPDRPLGVRVASHAGADTQRPSPGARPTAAPVPRYSSFVGIGRYDRPVMG